ncbi:MAG: isocitrate lyase/phosphoenolpyruvate mutase family protein [Polyangiaceae bacterium]|nr:isocitrate lyase/phosphoenolpyruvate mutase family protein [Polyangiaceae bacterium]
MTAQSATFRELHAGPAALVLPNAWDALSAKLLERAGAKAVATTSAAIAWTHGFQDREALPFPVLLAHVERMVGSVRVPLSVDCERGYGDDPAVVAAHVVSLARVGAAGVNLEDGTGAPDVLARKLEATRRALAAAGLDLFLNARTDVLLRGLGDEAEVARRARRYANAGADGIFVPGALSIDALRAVGAAVPCPLNVWASPALPRLDALAALGVRRVTVGPRLVLAAVSAMVADARHVLDGEWALDPGCTLTYREVDALFESATGLAS